jgi:hypothetical protein
VTARYFNLLSLILVLLPSLQSRAQAQESASYHVGLARIDITPRHPVRLNGFGFRRAESEGVTQRIWAKAMAIDDGGKGPVLLITVDILGIPADIFDEIARRLEKRRA